MKRFVQSFAIVAVLIGIPAMAVTVPTLPARPPGFVAPPIATAPDCQRGCMTPVEAVTFASYVAPKGAIVGEFAFEVQAVGEDRRGIYLNSEKDYRDRNCLTIATTRRVIEALAGTRDLASAQKALIGKRILVRGVARRVQIDFLDGAGRPSGKYYYQVHVDVNGVDQIALGGRA